jgi:CBS domain containing-hemolysin-like protein
MLHLSLHTIGADTLQIPGADPWHANAQDPAVTVMTDFRERASVTVAESATIDAALDHMKHAGVRSAFAIDAERHVVVGLITAYDIASEKPMRLLHTPRHEVLVRDIMEKISDWRVIDFAALSHANVAAVAQLFEDTRRTHIPVMENNERGAPTLRGLLSSARVRKVLVP